MGELNLYVKEELIQSANVFFSRLTLDGEILFLNKYALDLVGFKEEEILGKNWFEIFILPESQDEISQLFKESLTQNNPPKVLNINILSKDKQKISLTASISILFDEEHRPFGIAIFGLSNISRLSNIGEDKEIGERLRKLSECFLGFGVDPVKNINRLVALCGELMKADCALYNCLENDVLCSRGKWNTPSDYSPVSKPEGHICYDVIKEGSDNILVVRNLPESRYALTDPGVNLYGLRTYIGKTVSFSGAYIGSLCVLYKRDFIPSEDDNKLMGIIASAIGVEEERKYENDELRESEGRFKTLFDNAMDGIVVVDPETRKFCMGNSMLSNMLGYSQEEIKCLSVTDIHPKEDLPRVLEQFEKLVRDEINFTEGIPVKRKNGSIFYVNISISKMKMFGKTYIVGLFRDDTEHRKAEELLRRSEERYRKLVETAPDAIYFISSENGEIKLLNPAFEKITGWKPCEWIGKNFTSVVHPDDLPLAIETFNQILEGKSPPAYELRILSKSGEYITGEFTSTPFVEGDKVVGEFGMVRDITERKKMQDALKESEYKYKTLLINIPHRIFYKDKNLSYITCNDSYADDLGITPSDIVGRTDYDFYPKELADKYRNDDVRIIKKGLAEEIEEKHIKDGKEYFVYTLKAPVRDTKGNILGIFGIFWDITERKMSEESTRRLNTALTKTNKKLHQMALKDTQTGLYNHRYLTEIIESEFHRAKRYGSPISVIMLDLDYFKSINDVYGHNFGDMVLGQLASLFNRTVRNYDIVTRFGGEEFVFILPDTDPKGAMMLANRILGKISLHSFGTSKQIVHLKASLGVVTYPQDKVLTGMDLVNLADQLLNKVKDRGGNNVYSTLDIGRKEEPLEDAEESGSESIKYMQEKINRLTKRANRSLMEAIFAFARTIELKDHYTGEHVEKTVYYAVEMAKALGLLNEEIEKIRDASMLHDLGKIGISEKILLKKSKLTPKEFTEIKKHPQIGADIIRPIHFMHDIIPLILYHHERYDGKGYLNGLKGEQIPIGARIIAVADVYQALTSNRPYRKAYSKKEAIEMIKNGAGTQFDPHIVDVFLGILSK